VDAGKGLSTADLMREHASGVQFKLLPVRTSAPRASLQAEQDRLRRLGLGLWLWLESRRLGRASGSASAYALDVGDLCPETSPLRNLLVNLRTFGARGLDPERWLRYPRERLLRSLALLLWEPASLQDPELRAYLHAELRTTSADLPGLVKAYQQLWQRFN
jgi:hypothetical protein